MKLKDVKFVTGGGTTILNAFDIKAELYTRKRQKDGT